MRDFVFLQGKLSNVQGQEIHARVEDDGTVLFYDPVRDLCGELHDKMVQWPSDGEAGLLRLVLRKYAANQFTSSRRANDYARLFD